MRRAAIALLTLLTACADHSRTHGYLEFADDMPADMRGHWLNGADAWNDAVGETIVSDDPYAADFRIHAMVGYELIESPDAGRKKNVTWTLVNVWMRPGETAKDSVTIAMHELAHAFGLKHSSDEHSVLFYRLTGDQTITAADVLAMRKAVGLDEQEAVGATEQALVKAGEDDECTFGGGL